MTDAPELPAVFRPSIYLAMNRVMSDVQTIGKGQTSDSGGFAFRGVDAVVNAVGPVLRRRKVVVVPHHVASLEHERYSSGGKAMDSVTVTVDWRFYAIDGSFIAAASAGQAADEADKATPKAMSVAYRTVLLEALCIPTGDADPDHSVPKRDGQPATARDQRQALFDEIRAAGVLAGADDDLLRDRFMAGYGHPIDAGTPAELTAFCHSLHGRNFRPAGDGVPKPGPRPASVSITGAVVPAAT
jgi:hypothetical protein